jgi:hypothetical protein
MGNSKVVIDIIAPNSRTFNMLEFVLQQHGKGRFELSRGNRPNLVVVDFDKSDVLIAFRKFRSRFPDTPAVLLLNRPEEYEVLPKEVRIGAELILLKPFAAKDFISKINECLGVIAVSMDQSNSARSNSQTGEVVSSNMERSVSSSIKSRAAQEPTGRIAARPEITVPLQTSPGTQSFRPAARQRTWESLEKEEIAYSFAFDSDIDMSDDAAVANIWLKTDNKLFGYLRSAISQQSSAQSAICLSVGDSLNFFISPYARTISVVGKLVGHLELAQQELGNFKVSVSESAMPDKSVHRQLEMESFLWQLALYTYRGNLPVGTSVNQPMYLKYWPNLTRLEPTPNAMRIASLLSRQPVALSFIVRILNIPQRHVFNFYAAANAIGFAGPAVREVDNMLLPSYPDEMIDLPPGARFDSTHSRNKNA